MFSLIWAWINCWVNNCGAGDLSRHRAHYDVTVMVRLHRVSAVCAGRWYCTAYLMPEGLIHIDAWRVNSYRCMKEATHWGWVTHICVKGLIHCHRITHICVSTLSHGSDNGSSPVWVLVIGHFQTNFSEILIQIEHPNASSKLFCHDGYRVLLTGNQILTITLPRGIIVSSKREKKKVAYFLFLFIIFFYLGLPCPHKYAITLNVRQTGAISPCGVLKPLVTHVIFFCNFTDTIVSIATIFMWILTVLAAYYVHVYGNEIIWMWN